MKKPTKGEWLFLALWGVLFILTVVLYPQLPEEIPLHWNIAGEVDRTGERAAAFLPLAIIAGLFLLYKLSPKIDPKKANYPQFSKAYRIVFGGIILLMAAIQMLTLFQAVNSNLPSMDVLVLIGVGLLFLIIGNQIPRLKHNFFMGIRTPWTLADDTVWWKTHRFSGKTWVIGGILIILAAFSPLTFRVILIIGSILSSDRYRCCIHIYFSAKQQRRKKMQNKKAPVCPDYCRHSCRPLFWYDRHVSFERTHAHPVEDHRTGIPLGLAATMIYVS